MERYTPRTPTNNIETRNVRAYSSDPSWPTARPNPLKKVGAPIASMVTIALLAAGSFLMVKHLKKSTNDSIPIGDNTDTETFSASDSSSSPGHPIISLMEAGVNYIKIKKTYQEPYSISVEREGSYTKGTTRASEHITVINFLKYLGEKNQRAVNNVTFVFRNSRISIMNNGGRIRHQVHTLDAQASNCESILIKDFNDGSRIRLKGGEISETGWATLNFETG